MVLIRRFDSFMVGFMYFFEVIMEYYHTIDTRVLLQGVICLQRKVATKDHKLVYFLAGASAALSALIEKKSRRSELALYTLPRAGDSLWHVLVNRNLLPNIKHAEVSTFSISASPHMTFDNPEFSYLSLCMTRHQNMGYPPGILGNFFYRTSHTTTSLST